jgi:transcriptional regulator with XRE-family HTH domain
LCAPRKILEATALNKQYHRYEDIANVPDRLRWCRHSRGMTQREVAGKLGLALHTYKNIEAGITKQIPEETVERLARYYNVPVVDLTDEFGCFLLDGQAKRIRAYRESFGLGKKPFARKMGIPIRSLQEWENERKAISYKCWERYFKGRA